MKNTTNIINNLLKVAKIDIENDESAYTEVEGTNYYLEAQLTLLESGYEYSFKLYRKLFQEVSAETIERIPLTEAQELRIAEVLLGEFPEEQETEYTDEEIDNYLEHGVRESDFISYNHK